MLLACLGWQQQCIMRCVTADHFGLQADCQLRRDICRRQVVDGIEALTLRAGSVEGMFNIMPDSKRLQQQNNRCEQVKHMSLLADGEQGLVLIDQKFGQQSLINFRQGVKIGHRHALINLVNGGIERPQFDHLSAGGCDKAAIGGTA